MVHTVPFHSIRLVTCHRGARCRIFGACNRSQPRLSNHQDDVAHLVFEAVQARYGHGMYRIAFTSEKNAQARV